MPSVKVTSTELLGEMSYTTTYEFSSFEDFQKWESDKQQALVSNISNIFSVDLGDGLPDDFSEKMKQSFEFEAKVKKKGKGDLH